jgi:putative FmdB family regulatory protein
MVTGSVDMAIKLLSAAVPTYEYRCENGHLFEVTQKITEEPITACTECEAPVQRVYSPIAIHFKGSGFYNTDYGTSKRKRELDRSASEGADKNDAKQKEKRESKTADASSSSSSSSSTDSSGSSSSSSSSSDSGTKKSD